ncbi:MAG: CDP-alcohol phosphatidyltransferase family protein [Burkholderiales bacterium]
MSIYALKPKFQALLRPLVTRLAAAGVTANQVTLAACLISLAVGAVVWWHAANPVVFLLIPVWMLLRMALNAVDGMLAREFGQKSALGAYLNEITDVLSDAALYFPFAFLPGSSMELIVLVIVLSAVSELAGIAAVLTGASRRYDGPMGKSDRAFVFGLIGLLAGLGVPLPGWLNYAWMALVVLIGITIRNRIRRGLAELQR